MFISAKKGMFTFEEVAKIFLALIFLFLIIALIFLFREKMIELITAFFGLIGVR